MMVQRAIACLAFALTASCAWAQGYVGVALGQAKYRDACAGAASSISCSSSDTSLRIVGGYKFNPYFALEVGGNTLGTVHASTGESADLQAFDVSALISWPVAGRFALHGRLGTYFGDTTAGPDTSYPVPAIFPPPPPPPRVGWVSGNTVGGTYGIGATYEMTQNVGFRLEWQRFEYFGGHDPYGSGNPTIGVDVLSIGALLRF